MLLFFILGAVSLAQSSCPNGGTYQSLFDKCVYLSNDSLAYWDAEGSCQSNGGHLLSITSAFQNSLLSGMLPSSSTDVWIGLFRSYVGSDWKWIDGTPLVYKATFDYNTCQQKNNLYGSISDYIWRCDEYSVKKRYFCELPQTPYVPLTCQNGGNWDDVFQTCLLPGKDALFHDDAAIYCASFGGTLLSIHSAEQNDYLTNYTVTYNVAVNGGIWLGASRAWYGGNWTWDDGTPFAYNRLNGSLFYTDVNYYYANYLMMVIPLGLWDASDSDGVGYGYGFYCSLPKQKYISAPLTSTPATINPICPNGGDYDGIFKGCLFAAAWEKHEFAVVSEWKDGEQVCNSYGGHLVSIHSDEQNERFTLWASMNNLGLGSYLWLGASRSNQLADFTWTDGTPFNYAKVDSSTNDCSVTDYNNDIMGVYIPNGTWSCFSSSDKHDWACLLPTVSAPTITNTPAQRHSTPDPRCLSYGTYDDVFDACIYTSPTKQLYFDAEDDCITKGGHLVSIHSLEQNQRLIDIAMMINFQLGEEAFIGLVRDNSTAPWRWTDGSPVDYTGNVVETACSPGSTQTTLQMTIKGDWSCAHQMFEYYICKIRKT